jgi:hypothetical protein
LTPESFDFMHGLRPPQIPISIPLTLMRLSLSPAYLISLGLPLLLGSCAVHDPVQTHQRPSHRPLYRWDDDGGEGKVSIRISLPDQVAEFKRGGREIGWCYVATGKEGYGTTPGTYKITEKIVDKYSNRYGWFEDEFGNVTDPDAKSSDRVPPGMVYVPAPMPYWMRLTSYGIGMHGGVIPEPGQPASHGCIRLPKNFVPRLFEVVSVGTPVVITNEPSIQGPFRYAAPLPEREFRAGVVGSGGVESVTYRNGVPVSYR